MPATAALLSVATTPVHSAENATLATRPTRSGASWARMPIWMPRLEMLPKPQTAKVAMRRERSVREA